MSVDLPAPDAPRRTRVSGAGIIACSTSRSPASARVPGVGERERALDEARTQGTIERGADADDVDVRGDDLRTVRVIEVLSRAREDTPAGEDLHDALAVHDDVVAARGLRMGREVDEAFRARGARGLEDESDTMARRDDARAGE